MKYKKILSIVSAATLAVAPVSMNVYAESSEQTEAVVSVEEVKEPAVALSTTKPVTTQVTTTAKSTTTSVIAKSTTSVINKSTTTSTTKKSTTAKALTTTTTTATTVPATTTTKVNAVKIEPVCQHIVKSDINGRILVELPQGVSAKAVISYKSPEDDAHKYYNCSVSGGKIYAFNVEGRDTTEDDYRIYSISVTITDSETNISIEPYNDTFTIPDGNDNPDSYKEITYKFTVDGTESDSPWTVKTDTETKKEIALHFSEGVLGDVNGDKTVDSSDASLVLTEYAIISTGGESSLTASQKRYADVNKSGTIDSTDASKILAYYAVLSTGGKPSWD